MLRIAWNAVFYEFMRSLCRCAVIAFFRYRAWGWRHTRHGGAVLVCSNHQSHLDPIVLGVAINRHVNYLARKTLFISGPFGWLIRSLNSIPIDRDGLGISGIKKTLRRLKRGEAVVMFPEGTRSRDGEIAPLLPGICAIARRGKAALLPAGIDGAFRAWPRDRKLPGTGTIHVHFGQPIEAEEVSRLSDEELLAELTRRMCACHEAARATVAGQGFHS
jgi:1-acyl-sn-glycerol-3-phosphate acyltransferase